VYVDKKGRERHTIKPKSTIIDRAGEIKKSLYSKQYTKTYVVCEKPSAVFPERIGLPLELAPTRDISSLAPGQDLELKVYFNGELFSGQGIWDATYSGFSTESEDNFYPKAAVSGDTVRIHIPHPGRWFVRYYIKIDATGNDLKKYTQMKHTATLVFQIPNERKTPESGSTGKALHAGDGFRDRPCCLLRSTPHTRIFHNGPKQRPLRVLSILETVGILTSSLLAMSRTRTTFFSLSRSKIASR
jgi:hypothetical protein